MKDTHFDILVSKLDEHARDTMRKKGPEYTMQDEDILNNFKSTAKKLGVDPLIVWYAYFDKQVSSVAAHVSNHDLNKAEPNSAKSTRFCSLHSIFAPKSKTTFIPF